MDTAAPLNPCRPPTRAYCSFGTSILTATKDAGSWKAFMRLSRKLITYRCQICRTSAECSTNTASVPQAASRSTISIMRFLFCLSTMLPARKRKKIVGRKVHTVSRVTLDAVPLWLYTQIITA